MRWVAHSTWAVSDGAVCVLKYYHIILMAPFRLYSLCCSMADTRSIPICNYHLITKETNTSTFKTLDKHRYLHVHIGDV